MIIYATVDCPGCREPVANDYEIRHPPSSLFDHPVPPSVPLELVADGQTYQCRSCGLEFVTVLSFDTSQP